MIRLSNIEVKKMTVNEIDRLEAILIKYMMIIEYESFKSFDFS